MSVRLSTTFRGNSDFSAPHGDIAPIFLCRFPLINEHLFCKYFVRLSVANATKALLLMDVVILVLRIIIYFLFILGWVKKN